MTGLALGRRAETASVRWDVLVLPGLLVLAALLRFPDLATRGTWDGDQGHDMLVLRAFVRDGVVPLLGPPTSIGDVHHGAWYYYLLAPFAWLTGGDSPTAVVAAIAGAGVAAVGVVWWLARAIAGSVAGAIAGVLLATSAAAIEGSTFIWNPNLIALTSGIALASGWRAQRGGSGWWWVPATVGLAMTMQCHVLGVALAPVLAVPFLRDVGRRPLRRVALAVMAVLLLAYAPLIVNELTTSFSETRALLAYVGGSRGADAAPIPVRLGIVGLRVVSWPLVGLITDGFGPAVLATMLVVALTLVAARRGTPPADPAQTSPTRAAARWLGLGLLWTVVFLTAAAPSLAVVVRGLPNDHYHAFADPMVVVLIGVGMAAVIAPVRQELRGPAAILRMAACAAVLIALVGWNLVRLPPPTHPDGGWPAGARAADAVLESLRAAGVAASDVVLVRSLPDFKSTEAVAYPLVRAGQAVHAATPRGDAPGSAAAADTAGASAATAPALVLLCDDLFKEAIGSACGGTAEDAAATALRADLRRLDLIEAHPGRWIAVYGGAGASGMTSAARP